jgi:hypothetical protein
MLFPKVPVYKADVTSPYLVSYEVVGNRKQFARKRKFSIHGVSFANQLFLQRNGKFSKKMPEDNGRLFFTSYG